jgi:hypothetical protein
VPQTSRDLLLRALTAARIARMLEPASLALEMDRLAQEYLRMACLAHAKEVEGMKILGR